MTIPKKIVIVSPQPWDHIAISKHHYALELARRGHKVMFVNPPNANLKSRFVVSQTASDNIQTLEYRRPWFYRLRFHWRSLYDQLMGRFIFRLIRTIDFKPDVCWCFEFNLFSNLDSFCATKTIFHPVDPLSELHHTALAQNADIVLTVSERIAQTIRKSGSDVHVVGHGLAETFARRANQRLGHPTPVRPAGKEIRVGYAGNLMRRPLNRAVLRRLVTDHPSVRFHFWGPYESSSIDSESGSFISFLKSNKHVHLHGQVSADRLADEIQQMDAFVLVYGLDAAESDRSNSHKILEYLSTGRVVVSSQIDHYVDSNGLLEMPSSGNDDDIPALFAETMNRIEKLNSRESMQKRIEYALEQTYATKVDHIEGLLANLETKARPSRARHKQSN